MALPQSSTPKARWHKSDLRLLCGSEQNGRYWCAGDLGTLFACAPLLRQPYDENAQRVRELGFELGTLDLEFVPGEGLVADRPVVLIRVLQFPEGWSWQGRYWGRGPHAERAAQRNRALSGFAKPGPLGRRAAPHVCVDPDAFRRAGGAMCCSIPRLTTPARYPTRAKCPDCGLEQEVNGTELRLGVWHEVLPYVDGLWPQRTMGQRGIDIQHEGFSSPEAAIVFYLARGRAERFPNQAQWWQRLGDWALTASPLPCRRCLDALAAGGLQSPYFAFEFLQRRGRF